MQLFVKALLALTLLLCLNLGATAQGSGPKTDPEPDDPAPIIQPIIPGTTTSNSEGGFEGGLIEADVAGDIQSRYETAGLDVLDASIFGDHVDIDTGALSFVHIDVSLPGNSGLPVHIGRSLSPLSAGWGVQDGGPTGFANWDATIPHIRQTFITENGPQLDRCTGTLGGPYLTYGGAQGADLIYRWQFWNGLQLSMGGKPIALLEYDNSPEFNGQSPRLVSKQGDIITCLSDIGGGLGEGFKLTRRDGTSYEFNKRVEFNIENSTENFDDRLELFFVTRIEDVHGNYVNYTYSGSNLTRIEDALEKKSRASHAKPLRCLQTTLDQLDSTVRNFDRDYAVLLDDWFGLEHTERWDDLAPASRAVDHSIGFLESVRTNFFKLVRPRDF